MQYDVVSLSNEVLPFIKLPNDPGRASTSGARVTLPYYTMGTSAQGILFPWDKTMDSTQEESMPKTIKQLRAIPYDLIEKYIPIAMKLAIVEKLEDGTWYAEIPELPGVWADAEDSPETALKILGEVLEDWVIIKIENNDGDIPVMENINLNLQ